MQRHEPPLGAEVLDHGRQRRGRAGRCRGSTGRRGRTSRTPPRARRGTAGGRASPRGCTSLAAEARAGRVADGHPVDEPEAHVLEDEASTTRSRSLPRRAPRCSASTGASASPSLSPDSRLSEWRMNRGTRGFVTTLEDSIGSVGDSSAPTQEGRGPVEADRAACAASATTPAGDRHADPRACAAGPRHSLCSSSPSILSPSRNRITISATSASSVTKPDRALKSSTSKPPSPSASPASTYSGVIARKLRRVTPEPSAPITSSAPNTSAASLNCVMLDQLPLWVRPCPAPGSTTSCRPGFPAHPWAIVPAGVTGWRGPGRPVPHAHRGWSR